MKTNNEENIEIKEEGKFKTWFKKHKTTLAVGSTALVGAGASVLAYRMGFKDGYLRASVIEGVKAFDEGVRTAKEVVSDK